MDKATLTAFVEKFYATDVDFPGFLGSLRGTTLVKRPRRPPLKQGNSANVSEKRASARKNQPGELPASTRPPTSVMSTMEDDTLDLP